MNTNPSHAQSTGPVTRRIMDLLPDLRRGDPAALNDVITIAHTRLLRLIHDMLGGFRGEGDARNYRGDEQTGVILSNLYLRLRRAVESQKLAELNHPAGFWKIAADNVMFILLDLARDRKRDRERRHGSTIESPADARRSSAGEAPRASRRHGTDASEESDSQANALAQGRPLDPLEQLDDRRLETVEAYMTRQDVLEAIKQLPEPHGTILKMYYYVGLTQREICEILQPSEPHLHERKVGRIIDQAEEKLRPLLERTAT